MLVQKPVTAEKIPGSGQEKNRRTSAVKENSGKVKLNTLFRDILDSRVSEKSGKKAFFIPADTESAKKAALTELKAPSGDRKEAEALRLGRPEKILFAKAGKPGTLLSGQDESPEDMKDIPDKSDGESEELHIKPPVPAAELSEKSRVLPQKGSGVEDQILEASDKGRPASGNRIRAAEGREQPGGRKGPGVTVVDLRMDKAAREGTSPDPHSGQSNRNGQEGQGNRHDGGDSVILVKGDAGGSPAPAQSARPSGGAEFAGHLDRMLKGDLGKEIVKQAGIVVKDDGKGEIRLVLQPERLGKVRIHLDLEDNHIAAKILVENSSIRDVFEQNLEHLARTFREGGFTADSLAVSVQGDGTDQAAGRRNGRGPKHLAGEMEALVPLMEDEIREESTVNMIV